MPGCTSPGNRRNAINATVSSQPVTTSGARRERERAAIPGNPFPTGPGRFVFGGTRAGIIGPSGRAGQDESEESPHRTTRQIAGSGSSFRKRRWMAIIKSTSSNLPTMASRTRGPRMALLIDGYNLLNAVSILGRGRGPGGLQRAREAMLNVLAESIPPDEVPRTIVVFDASESPWGSARALLHKGLRVQFAPRRRCRYPDRGIDPRRFGPQAADGRFQRPPVATGRPSPQSHRGGQRHLVRPTHARPPRALDAQPETNVKPEGPFSPGEVEFWLKQFGAGGGVAAA